MNQNILGEQYSPIILVAKDYQHELKLTSQILDSSNQLFVAKIKASTILTWAQQHQPDLIILDLECSKIVESGIVTALRLDWLTRSIPIVVISDSVLTRSRANFDCDVYLNRTYSETELEKVICSLVSSPVCKTLPSLL